MDDEQLRDVAAAAKTLVKHGTALELGEVSFYACGAHFVVHKRSCTAEIIPDIDDAVRAFLRHLR